MTKFGSTILFNDNPVRNDFLIWYLMTKLEPTKFYLMTEISTDMTTSEEKQDISVLFCEWYQITCFGNNI